MSRRDRREERDEEASPELSRLIIMGFLIAGALGLISGVVWMLWTFVTR
jgi:hypothetical protein